MLPCWGEDWFHRLHGCHCPGASVCMLVDKAGSQDLWLQGPGSSAYTVLYGAESWAFWWTEPCPGAVVGPRGLNSVCLLVGGAVSL